MNGRWRSLGYLAALAFGCSSGACDPAATTSVERKAQCAAAAVSAAALVENRRGGLLIFDSTPVENALPEYVDQYGWTDQEWADGRPTPTPGWYAASAPSAEPVGAFGACGSVRRLLKAEGVAVAAGPAAIQSWRDRSSSERRRVSTLALSLPVMSPDRTEAVASWQVLDGSRGYTMAHHLKRDARGRWRVAGYGGPTSSVD